MARILLTGSDRGRLRDLRSILREDGHEVRSLAAVDGWREAEREIRPELVVGAVTQPDDLLTAPGARARGFPPPVLLIRSEDQVPYDPYLDERLIDVIDSPFMSEELLGRVDALIRARRVVLRVRRGPHYDAGQSPRRKGGPVRGWLHRASALLGTRVPRRVKPLAPYLEVASRIADWADRRDAFEPGHAARVASCAATMADSLGLSESECSALVRASMLHDIGKVALPVELLRQTTPLREEQRRLIQTHPRRGASLLRALDRDQAVIETILYHHEQPDGEGYYGKADGEYPRTAALLGVAEAYDAMTTTRVGSPLSRDAALTRLREQSGWKYDASAVDALCDALEPAKDVIPLSR